MKKIYRWITLFLITTMLIQATTFAEEIYESPEVYNPREILVNQLGYYSKLSKTAVIKVAEGQNVPLNFTVTNKDNDVVFFGSTSDYRSDADSGFYTQSIDFSLLKTPGDYLINCNNTTAKICIKDSLFEDLSDDAFNYFYQNRSGLTIKSYYITSGNPYLLTRAADHQSDIGYIQSQWKNDYESDGNDIETFYSTDATGGWLDGDDMASKTVVAGAYTAWRLQNIYEIFRMMRIESIYADGTQALPESENAYPDLLDEARFELEYLLKLVVKSGTYKGMLYSGVCDYKPFELPIQPEEDNLERIVKPVSTDATLNAAAVFAQGYRLWLDIDPSFANEILNAAKTAYSLAQQNSNIGAPKNQVVYGDDNYSDNFYWAACELYSATGDSTYYSDITNSLYKFQFKTTSTPIAFTVTDTAALGSISLLINKDIINSSDSSTLETNLETTAKSCIELMKNQSFGQPYSQEEVSEFTTGYKWNSNENILNNVFLVQCASLLCEKIYFVGCAASGMDYIFGKNPLDISYVTGYGTHCVENICHPYWGNPVDSSFPASPNGVMALGPCSSSDNLLEMLGMNVDDVPPALMYADYYQAYDVNRSSITANSALFATSTLMELLYNDYYNEYNHDDYDDYIISIDAVSNNNATIYSPNQFKSTLIFAAYDANNRLKKIDIQNNTTIAAGSHIYYASESFKDIDGLKVKVMLWENMINNIPICKTN